MTTSSQPTVLHTLQRGAKQRSLATKRKEKPYQQPQDIKRSGPHGRPHSLRCLTSVLILSVAWICQTLQRRRCLHIQSIMLSYKVLLHVSSLKIVSTVRLAERWPNGGTIFSPEGWNMLFWQLQLTTRCPKNYKRSGAGATMLPGVVMTMNDFKESVTAISPVNKNLLCNGPGTTENSTNNLLNNWDACTHHLQTFFRYTVSWIESPSSPGQSPRWKLWVEALA